MMVQAISRQNYTNEELNFAANRLQVDPELDKKLSFPDSRITAADFERHVNKFQSLQNQISSSAKLSRYEVSKLIDEFPGIVGWENFGVCGYTAQDEPLYRYTNSKIQNIPPSPRILDLNKPDRDKGSGTGLIKLNELLK